MTCFFCKGSMEQSTTTHVVESGERVIVIKHVPCQKCRQCGEVVYSGSVAERLEEITEQVEKALTEIAVVSYSVA
ncbi:MAG: type II toxin-antitoxin system MqsA family antitoxin [Bacteroides sp.]|nr:type II toxin-antitoxin system MqsA family antitoxin [Eubacterium sp.]MCM1418763.1 type II toxin-antitoxin system MqsA family antitoxin [Roseburia sp.]MCM1462008.1 type II toxin-antitoxin system MqsA family antitoxin [Bacteroides sp.]